MHTFSYRLTRLFAALLLCAIFLQCAPAHAPHAPVAYAEERYAYAFVKSGGANVRKTPNGTRITQVSGGTPLLLLGEACAEDGDVWRQVRLKSGQEGYIHSNLLTPSAHLSADSTENAFAALHRLSPPREASGASASSAKSASSSPSRVTSQPKQTVMVYVSRTGSCYHRRSHCSNMKNPSSMSLEDAQRMGRHPCSKCY